MGEGAGGVDRITLSQGYGIMSNAVLFSKELTDKQKLLFCLISSLCAEKGYCRATNEYLGELLNADKGTISKNISALQEKGFIAVKVDKDSGNQRKITMAENDNTIVENAYRYSQKGQDPIVKNDNIILQDNITNENNYSFQDFWKDYPHTRKGKKKESEKYFKENDCLDVKKQVSILKRQIKAGIQDEGYVPACERWIRDFTPINDDVLKQKLIKICKWHLNAGGDMKERSMELKQTFGEQQINEIVKMIQQKDSPKNLFIKQTN